LICLKDTVTGFLLGGIGELNAKTRKPNFLIVDKSSFEQEKNFFFKLISN
jgi:vacuolar-type H+-ATPase subunit F/Vma7